MYLEVVINLARAATHSSNPDTAQAGFILKHNIHVRRGLCEVFKATEEHFSAS